MESDPQPKHLQPEQFYYEQEHQLFSFCASHPETSWNIVRPAAIIGAVNKTWLNAFFCFGVYAAVQAYKGEPLGTLPIPQTTTEEIDTDNIEQNLEVISKHGSLLSRILVPG
jgi:hypothetical protein